MNKLLLLLIIVGFCSFTGKGKNNWLCSKFMKGHVKCVTEYCKSNDISLSGATTIALDTNGNIIDELHFDENDSKFNVDLKFAYKYNTNGNMVEENHYNDDGFSWWHIVFIYDENDNVIEASRYSGIDDHPEKRIKYLYDTLGHNVEILSFYGDILDGKLKCIYDANNRKIEEFDEELPDTLSTKSSREIWRYYMNGQLYADSLYEGGNLAESETFYNLKFDSVGNWIKRTAVIHKSDNPVNDTEILTRKIAYY